MVERDFAFYVAIKRRDMVKNFKIRCDYKDEIELGGTLIVDDIKILEGEILRVTGKFGAIDLGITTSDLKKVIKKEVSGNE
ncbi:MAG: hypothetical protein V3V92_03640 [Candidatus Hydrothermarchaeales archaeon]